MVAVSAVARAIGDEVAVNPHEVDPTTLSKETLALLELGDELVKTNQLDAALDKFQKAIQMNQYHPRPYAKKADLLLTLNRYHEAIEAYKHVLFLIPDSVPTMASLGSCYVFLGDSEKALETFEKAVYLDPYYTPLNLERGRLLSQLGRLEEANKDFERIREKDRTHLDAGILLAGNKLIRGLAPEAKEIYVDLIALDPQNVQALAGLAILAYSEGQHGESVAYLSRALDSPQLANDLYRSDLLTKRASSYTRLGDFEKAFQDANKAAQLEPTNYLAKFVRGQLFFNSKRFMEAIEDFSFFLEENEKRFNSAENLPEAIVMHRSQKSQILTARATCHLHLLFLENPPLQKYMEQLKQKKKATPADEITKEFVEDLLTRITATKNNRMQKIFEDYLAARVEVLEAKAVIDPKLRELKDIANGYLRVM